MVFADVPEVMDLEFSEVDIPFVRPSLEVVTRLSDFVGAEARAGPK
jgi:hypothetical protein